MEKKNKDKRVIELEVMEEIEDSGVSAIALVDEPAIEKFWVYMRKQNFVKPSAGESQSDFMGRCVPLMIDEGKEQDQAVAMCISMYEQEFMKFESYTDYPESATEAAKRALAWAEKNGWGDCGTPIGKARANQLANREPISEETIARMASFYRHKQNADTPYSEGCGKLMWDAWGGTAGIEWASNKLESIRTKLSYDVSGLPPYVDETQKKKRKFNEFGCPEATVDIELNLVNRQEAIDAANYGPLNPGEPNEDYWQAKADKFNTSVEDAKSATCGNCGFFVRTKSMLACIAAGIGEEPAADPYDAIAAGELGYCEAFDFKCAADRTCDAWIAGGPILEEQEFIEPNPCWDGYEAYGTKILDGKEVPNCVPVKSKKDKFIEPNPCWDGYEAYGTKIVDGKEVPNCVPIKSKKQVEIYKSQFAIEKDKQIIVGPAMIPDIEIYRKDDENPEGYFVKFSKETIAKIQEKFMRELRIAATNLNHDEEKDGKSYVFESWIVEDPKNDKANKVYNLNVPEGTWMIKMKVQDPQVWQAVKDGKYRGFSIEGNFIDKAEMEEIERQKEAIESIMRILEEK